MGAAMIHRFRLATAAAVVCALVVVALPRPAHGQDTVELVVPDAKVVASGIRASRLTGKDVVNERQERLGTLDDFIFGRDNHEVFAVVAVGDGPGFGHLVAVPMDTLKLNDPSGKI